MALQKYKALLRTVERGSISRAAEELGYTQSAVSRMILDLEQDWGVTLLYRSRGGLTLSSEGLALLPRVRSLCREAECLEAKVRELHGLEGGLLRIGTFSSVSVSWLPGLMQRFSGQYPKVEFQLRNGEYREIAQWLRRGEIDCGFLCAPFPQDAQVSFLKRDALMVVLPEEHPMAQLGAYPLRALAQERFIMAKEDQDQEIAEILKKTGQPVRPAYEANDDMAVLAMVEAGLGVSIMPELELKREAFRIRSLDFDEKQYRDIGLAVQRDGHLSAAAARFVELAVSQLRDVPEEP